ncbi:helix-turn-helix transcriptional regulator [Mycobacterium sp. OAE908]|uniref:AAA family ATPase n=1 Tax=Mycobacterium sp. OAE908 TaxID=2817899 RepID=UPI001AE180E1
MRLAWPLTGRSEQLRAIEAAIADADIGGIVISGPAGVGKSRIAREALALAAASGCETRWAVGTSSAGKLPAGAFAAWVEPNVTDALQLVRSVIDALTSASPGRTVAIGVDDVHLLDDLSTFVVHQIVQRRSAKVVLTVRDGDPVPQATREIWSGGHFEQLDLPPLSHDDTAALLAATLGGLIDPGVVQTVWRLTRGNVLYVRNIVEREIADGRLIHQHGRWQWTGEPVLPPSLVTMIESRIGSLPVAVSDVIDALAVGQPIELASLGRITDSAAVEEADRRGLIAIESVDDGVEVRLAHPLYGEVRRNRAAVSRLRRLRGLVAAELAKGHSGNDPRTVVRRATLSMESDLEPDADLLLRAAQGAVWLADIALAERLAEAAIRAGAGPEANFVRAHVLAFLSRGDEAIAVLAACPEEELTDADRARLAFLRSHVTLFTRRDPAGAKSLIDEAAYQTPSTERTWIDAFLAIYWAVMGKPQSAIEISRNFALDQLPGVMGAGTAMAISVAYGDAGRTSDSVAAAKIGYAIVERSFDAAQMRFIIADGHICALLQAGRIREAREVADRLQEQSADLPGPAQLFSNGQVGMAALAAGQLSAACGLLEWVVAAFSGDTTGWGYRYRLPHTVALAMLGSLDEAAAGLRELEQQRHPTWRYLDYEFAIAQAWVAAADGTTSRAISTLLSAAETAHDNGQLAAEVLCLQTATQFGGRSSGRRLNDLARTVEGPRAAIAARFAAALREGNGGELAAVSDEYEHMGDLVAAADSAAHAAWAFRHSGHRGSAYLCAARAESLAATCGGLSTPAVRKAAEPLPISDRQREIAMLVGEGLSAKAIAERLTLSVRTVEGHIYRAMSRTGVATREELAAIVGTRKPRR